MLSGLWHVVTCYWLCPKTNSFANSSAGQAAVNTRSLMELNINVREEERWEDVTCIGLFKGPMTCHQV